MAYCTIDDVREQIEERMLIQLTDDTDAGVIDESVVERAIADADAEIDGYVGSRHTVPLDPTPGAIRKLSVDLAIYNLYARRSDSTPEIREKRYDAAVKFLEQVAKGTISMGMQDPEGSPPSSDAPEMSSSNPDRTFSRDTLEGF